MNILKRIFGFRSATEPVTWDGPTRILVVADKSITMQRVFTIAFEAPKYRVITFSNSQDAIAFIEVTRPDIVFADIDLLPVNGYELCKYLRSKPGLANVPVFLLRGAFAKYDEDRALSVGPTGVMTKPFQSITVLIESVEAQFVGEIG